EKSAHWPTDMDSRRLQMRVRINPHGKLFCWASSKEAIVFFFLGILLSTLLLLLPSIGTVARTSQVSEKIGPRSKSEPWMKYEIGSIRYEVALEWLMGQEIGSNSKR